MKRTPHAGRTLNLNPSITIYNHRFTAPVTFYRVHCKYDVVRYDFLYPFYAISVPLELKKTILPKIISIVCNSNKNEIYRITH